MKKYFTFLLIVILIQSLLHSVTYIVKQDGSGDFTTIQQAINQSISGDIVLVHPGTYNENLLISQKSITLQSLYAIEPDTTYIHNTIIRGARHNSAIRVQATTGSGDIIHTNATINGFTIMNDRVINQYIVAEGGGINLTFSSGTIKNNIIKNNMAVYAGGGIALGGGILDSFFTDVYLENNRIYDNSVYSGGGGGLSIGYRNNLIFSQENRNSIYNNSASHGLDILFSWAASATTVYLDKGSRFMTEIDYFFVSFQQHTYEYEVKDTKLDILQETIPTIDGNEIYVSPSGDDNNSGLSEDFPLRSLDKATRMMAHTSEIPRTIYLAHGVYSTKSGQAFPFTLPKNVNLKGAGLDQTIFDGGGAPIMISIKRPFAHNEISDINVTNFGTRDITGIFELDGGTYQIENVQFENNYTRYAINVFASDVTVENVTIRDSRGASFFVRNSDILTMNNITIDNLYDDWTLGPNINFTQVKNVHVNNLSVINCHNTSSQIIIYSLWSSQQAPENPGLHTYNNVLVANNQGYQHPQWGTNSAFVAIANNYNVNILNNWTVANNIGGKNAVEFNTSAIGYVNNSIFYNPDIIHSNEIIECNSINNSLIYKANYGYPNAIASLINVNPIFAGMIDDSLTPDMPEYYYLHETSPCIDTGMSDVSDLNIPAMDLAGNHRIWNGRIDMGAFEYDSEPYVSIKDPTIPTVPNYHLSNYPNPFNPTTTISYTLHRAGNVMIDIYNIRGQKIKSLLDDFKTSGNHQIVWNGKDSSDRDVSSGIYFYQMKTSDFVQTKKMILMK